MRDLIFRAKRLDNGEWVQGANILMLGNENPADVYMLNEGDGLFVVEITESIAQIETLAHKVDPETVGQYTGFTDGAGEKIFENDVLTLNFEEDRFRVVFEGGSWFLHDLTDAYAGEYLVEFAECGLCRVIGNIHDNPELLKGGGSV